MENCYRICNLQTKGKQKCCRKLQTDKSDKHNEQNNGIYHKRFDDGLFEIKLNTP